MWNQGSRTVDHRSLHVLSEVQFSSNVLDKAKNDTMRANQKVYEHLERCACSFIDLFEQKRFFSKWALAVLVTVAERTHFGDGCMLIDQCIP